MEYTYLKGRKITKAEIVVDKYNSETFRLTLDNGFRFDLYHVQDCCEGVSIEDITEDYEDILKDSVIHSVYESSNREEENGGTCTWTFYRFVTDRGIVVLRWLGSSNGYYSEDVDERYYDPNAKV